jgi:hypothetical protein
MFMKKQKSRKAQSGMEYLMTYGWAVLIVGVIILLLMSLKVLDVDWFSIQNEVFGLSTFNVPDFKVTPHVPPAPDDSLIIFQLINNKGSNVTIASIEFQKSDGSYDILGSADLIPIYVWQCNLTGECSINATHFPFNMTAGQRFVVNGSLRGVRGDVNTVFTSNIKIKYNSTRSIVDHWDTGKVRGRVESTS